MEDHDFDILDLHYAFRRLTSHRAEDGIHWNNIIHRAITNMLLRHVCDAWHVIVPSSNSLLSQPPPPRQQMNSSNSFNSHEFQQIPTENRDGVWSRFDSDLTNSRGQPRQWARRGGRRGLRSYRHRPY